MSERRGPWAEGRVVSLLALLCSVALSGCGRQRTSEPFAGPVVLTERQALGERVFFKNCNECHPQGQAGLAPALNNKSLPAFLIKKQVRDPIAFMPPFEEADIPDDQLDALIEYLEVLRDPDEAQQQAPPSSPQPPSGQSGSGGGSGYSG
jgi:cytochrome c5